MTDWVDFAEVRAKVSLETVLFQFYQIDKLVRHGNKVVGPCPVHGGDSPRAFHADLSKNVWHCFTQCHRGGNQLDLVAAKEGITVREAALKLKVAFLDHGSTGPPRQPAAAATTPAVTPPAPAAPSPPTGHTPASSALPEPTASSTASVSTPTGAKPSKRQATPAQALPVNPPLKITLNLKSDHPYLLQTRGLSPATIEYFGIGHCSKGILRGCIAIPIHDERGVLVAYAGRHLRPSDAQQFGKYKFPAGFRKELVLYNLQRTAPLMADKGIVLVEGFFSVFKLHEAGFDNVVACMGCDLSEHQADLLAKAKEVIILFDGDPAGWQGSAKARERLESKVTVRVARLPTGVQPDGLSPKALSWLIRGMQVLDLSQVELAFRETAAALQVEPLASPPKATPATPEVPHG